MGARGLADPLDAERTRASARQKLFGGAVQPIRVGRFVVGDRIGSGGMGVVYAARDPELERDVALKVLHGGGGAAALVAEAKTLARLRHPNIVSVYEIGEFDGHAFVAMEHVGGPTLRAWLKEKPRSPREVLTMFVSAGRALSAAHAAGVVHRDFKPDNVVVDDAGQPRVVDFGLARLAEERDADEPPSSRRARTAHDSSHVRTRLAGTPAYMAPELWLGQAASSATDQFAFSVAVYEALVGRLPFGRDAIEAAAAGEALEAPQPLPSSLPRRVRAAVLRGLAEAPGDRHASMAALVAALVGDGPRWGRNAAIASLFVGAAASAGVVIAARRSAAPPLDHPPKESPCAGAESRLEDAWAAPSRGAVRTAFEATKVPYATSAFAAVERSLDAYAAEWRAMYVDSCEATNVRGDQSRELLDLRTLCLERRHVALRATVDALLRADGRTVERSASLVEALPPIAACADVEALRDAVPPPDDPAKRAKLGELTTSLEALRVTYEIGRLREAADGAPELVAQARALDHKPFLADALLLAGEIAIQRGDFGGAEASLSEAVKAAQGSGHMTVVARAAVRLVSVTGEKTNHPEKTQVWLDLAEASIERARAPAWAALLDHHAGAVLARQGKISKALPRMERAVRTMETLGRADTATFASFLGGWANVLDSAGRYDEALAVFQRALELEERLRGKDHPEIAITLNNMAIVLERKGRLEEARAAYQRAVDIAEALGTMDGIASFLDNLGGVLVALGRADEGLEKRLRAHEMLKARLPPNHPSLGASWNNLGQTYFRAKQYDRALDANEKSLAILRAAFPGDHPETANSLGNTSEVYEATGDLERALSLVKEAVAMMVRALGPEHPYTGYWLSTQGRYEIALERFPDAREHLTRAVPILEASGVMKPELARAQFDLARALWATTGDRPRARSLAETARQGLNAAGSTERLAEIDAWLRAH